MTTPLRALFHKFIQRFILCYLVLYIFPYGFEYLFPLNSNGDRFSFWTGLTPWFGRTFMGFEFDPNDLQKGLDSKYDFARFVLCALLSLVMASLLMFIDRKFKRHDEQKLDALIYLVLRYHVGLTLVLYGMGKVIPLQFGSMGFDRLELTTGEYSPMSFLWTFMSYSKFYTISTGLIEVIGGMFLLFRSTTLIGAMICFIAMANVVLLDIAYDVTVKFFAIHLFLMSFLLLKNDLERMVSFFIPGKSVSPHQLPLQLLTSPRQKVVGYIFKYALLGYFVFNSYLTVDGVKKTLYSINYQGLARNYSIEKFVINGDTLPALANDTIRWKSFVIGVSFDPEALQVRWMNNKRSNYHFKADTSSKTFEFKSFNDTTDTYRFRYTSLSNTQFVIRGQHKNDSIWIQSRPMQTNDYRLMKKGIQWIRNL